MCESKEGVLVSAPFDHMSPSKHNKSSDPYFALQGMKPLQLNQSVPDSFKPTGQKYNLFSIISTNKMSMEIVKS